MAKERSSAESRSHRPSNRAGHRQYGRKRSRSPSPPRRTNHPLSHPERGQSPPSGPKELFPDRRRNSPNRGDNQHVVSRDIDVKHNGIGDTTEHIGSRRHSRNYPPDDHAEQQRRRPQHVPSSPKHNHESRRRSLSPSRDQGQPVAPRGPRVDISAHEIHNHPSEHRRTSFDRSTRKRSRSRSISRNRHHKSARWVESEQSSRHAPRRIEPVIDRAAAAGREKYADGSDYDRHGSSIRSRHQTAGHVSQHSNHPRNHSPGSHAEFRQLRRSQSPLNRPHRGTHDGPNGTNWPNRRGSTRQHNRHLSRSPSIESSRSHASQRYPSGPVSPDRYSHHNISRDRYHNSGSGPHARSPSRYFAHHEEDYPSEHREPYVRPHSPGNYHEQSRPDNDHQSESYFQNTNSQSHHPSGFANNTSRGRGGSAIANRGHFQNLSWTPDKGSRGGIAPTERVAENESKLAADVNTDDNVTIVNDISAQVDKIEGDQESSPRLTQATVDPPPAQGFEGVPTAPKNNSIKFAMKVPAQPALAKRANVINSVPKVPARPSVFQATENVERIRRPEPPPPRGKHLPPSRLPPSRYDDQEPSRQHPRDTRHERDPYWNERPPLPPSRERRPLNARDAGPRPGPRYERDAPRVLKSSRPRRKKFKKVLVKHRRVVLPPRKLRKDWAQSDFIYYPKPDRNSVVGAGTYGKVFKAHNVYLNKCVALKTLPLIKARRKVGSRDYASRDKKKKRQDRWVKDGLHLTSLREVKLLKSVSHEHRNIVGVREFFLEGLSCNLVFDYFEFDMHGIIYSAKVGLEDAMMKDLCLQVFCGLDFLHTKARILHRDIKAANILVSAGGQVRITDFGLAKHVKEKSELDALTWYQKKFEHSNRVITTPYRPPELFLGATLYDGEVDVWSAGCVLFEAFLKKLPFQGTGEDVDHLLTIWKVLGLPNVNLYPEVVDLEWYWLFMSRVVPKKSIFKRLYKNKISPQLYHLLRCIFQLDPKKRPTASQIINHPFFTTESPLPQTAGTVLETVEGEWHELEYKMIRDKEKAEVRRKNEDNVILGYLKHKQSDHERKAAEEATENHAERVDFYKAEQDGFQARIDAREQAAEIDEDHVKQVAEMKKTHGDMYMDASRRGRFRGHAREKVDEKLLHEAWRWYEDEKKNGNTPIELVTTFSKVKPVEKPSQSTKTSARTVKAKDQSASSSALNDANQPGIVPRTSRADRRQAYEQRKDEYDRQLAKYQRRTAAAVPVHSEKREANSPLQVEREMKKVKE